MTPRPSQQDFPAGVRPKKWLAVHEAGHAVAAIVARAQLSYTGKWKFKGVTIAPEDNSLGHAAWTANYSLSDYAAYSWLLLTLYAGPEAERILARRSHNTVGSWGDLATAESVITDYVDGWAELGIEAMCSDVDDEIIKHSQRAGAFVRKERKAIIALANALLDKRTLSARAATTLVRPLLTKKNTSHAKARMLFFRSMSRRNSFALMVPEF
jgi:ATP-dependent Zn protease